MITAREALPDEGLSGAADATGDHLVEVVAASEVVAEEVHVAHHLSTSVTRASKVETATWANQP